MEAIAYNTGSPRKLARNVPTFAGAAVASKNVEAVDELLGRASQRMECRKLALRIDERGEQVFGIAPKLPHHIC